MLRRWLPHRGPRAMLRAPPGRRTAPLRGPGGLRAHPRCSLAHHQAYVVPPGRERSDHLSEPPARPGSCSVDIAAERTRTCGAPSTTTSIADSTPETSWRAVIEGAADRNSGVSTPAFAIGSQKRPLRLMVVLRRGRATTDPSPPLSASARASAAVRVHRRAYLRDERLRRAPPRPRGQQPAPRAPARASSGGAPRGSSAPAPPPGGNGRTTRPPRDPPGSSRRAIEPVARSRQRGVGIQRRPRLVGSPRQRMENSTQLW